MRLVGVGIDVVSIPRIAALLDRFGDRFERRWFDPLEVVQPGNRAVVLATGFAIKEAVWKALPHDTVAPLPWREIVTHRGSTTDEIAIELRGKLEVEADSHGVGAIAVTVSVRGDLVVAVALVEEAPVG